MKPHHHLPEAFRMDRGGEVRASIRRTGLRRNGSNWTGCVARRRRASRCRCARSSFATIAVDRLLNDSRIIRSARGVSPYRGCEHGCAYCFARPYHEYLGFSAGLDFESKIMVKMRAAELLREELSRRSGSRRRLR